MDFYSVATCSSRPFTHGQISWNIPSNVTIRNRSIAQKIQQKWFDSKSNIQFSKFTLLIYIDNFVIEGSLGYKMIYLLNQHSNRTDSLHDLELESITQTLVATIVLFRLMFIIGECGCKLVYFVNHYCFMIHGAWCAIVTYKI